MGRNFNSKWNNPSSDVFDGKQVVRYEYDQQTEEQERQGLLTTVFKDGKLVIDQKFSEIRERIWS